MAEAASLSKTTGKRKTAIARVTLALGKGQITVNGRPADEYFPREALQILIRTPLALVDGLGRYDVTAKIKGGGVAGQAKALRHGIARAIEKADGGQRPALKKAGMLTRDARKVERKKYGQKGARARFQFSKR